MSLLKSWVMPFLSVTMPAKNAGLFISQSIKAALTAMPSDSELLVLDDGSTDNTLDVISKFNDPRVRVFTRDQNKGIADARNFLLKNSDSAFVATIDADDVCRPSRFQHQLSAIENNDIVFSRVSYINQFGSFAGVEKFPAVSQVMAPFHLLLGNIFSNSTMFARRNVLSKLGGFSLATAEDYDLWLRASAHGFRLRKTHKPLVKYRLHPSQATASADWQQNAADEALISSYRALCEKILHFRPDFEANSRVIISAPYISFTPESSQTFKSRLIDSRAKMTSSGRNLLFIRMKMLERIYSSSGSGLK